MNAGRTRSSIFHPRRDQGEHRHTYELSWRGVLQTQLADLCLTNLLVFDADGETIKNYIKTHAATQDPFAYSRSQGISLHTAKELLSKEIRP
jgi:predicted amidohydrolase